MIVGRRNEGAFTVVKPVWERELLAKCQHLLESDRKLVSQSFLLFVSLFRSIRSPNVDAHADAGEIAATRMYEHQ
jgi:hypothetical protein